MASERVSVREGKLPLLLIAPHYEDSYTDDIAEKMADNLDCFAVINHGWKKADVVDSLTDNANCNSIKHCKEDVVRQEFYDPIKRFLTRINMIVHGFKSFVHFTIPSSVPFEDCGHPFFPMTLVLHGVSDNTRKYAKDRQLDIILGTGEGMPPRITCEEWQKNIFAWGLTKVGMNVWAGKAGGSYAAWDRDNLIQSVLPSIQVEIIRFPWRSSSKRAIITGNILTDVVKSIMATTKDSELEQFNTDLNLPEC